MAPGWPITKAQMARRSETSVTAILSANLAMRSRGQNGRQIWGMEMSKSLLTAACGAALLLSASSASAANAEFCRDYARAAVNQVRGAMSHGRCDWRRDRNPTRWSTDWKVHFDWCRGVSRDQADGERFARREALDHCAR
jgi:hypothetical protein